MSVQHPLRRKIWPAPPVQMPFVCARVTGDRAVFVVPGQGAQWEQMAVDLLDSSPVFAAEIAACGKAL
ncbi:acyltransferase domain-containing protein, partial [Streptomyces mirabilis]|uniref:acyltransferase domain-containing protein n=1 Tax=Streptomyces mirabilis TaxID=68239 RepID=UPI0036D8AE08